MSIRMLRTLIAVDEQETFSAAAERVFVTHAAVSQQMRTLENELGMTLFDRSTRTPKLTAEGRAIVAKARDIVTAYDTLAASVLNTEGLHGQILLGAVPTTLTGLLPLAMSCLRRDQPDIRLRLHSGLSTDLITQVERGLLDAALVSCPAVLSRDLDPITIAEEPLHLLAPAQSDSDDPVQLLNSQPYIRFSRDTVAGHLIDNWLQENGIRVQECMELHGLESIASMVFSNLGVSIVPRSCVNAGQPLPIKRISLGQTAPTRRLALVHRKDNPRSVLVKALAASMREAAEIGLLGATIPDRSFKAG